MPSSSGRILDSISKTSPRRRKGRDAEPGRGTSPPGRGTEFEVLGRLYMGFPTPRRYGRGDRLSLAEVLPVLPRAMALGIVKCLSPKPKDATYVVALTAHFLSGRSVEPGELLERELYGESYARNEAAGIVWPLCDRDLSSERICASCGKRFLGPAALAAHAAAYRHRRRKPKEGRKTDEFLVLGGPATE